MDAEELKAYFTLTKNNTLLSGNDKARICEQYKMGTSAIMNVVGRCYPVDIFYVQGNNVFFVENVFV